MRNILLWDFNLVDFYPTGVRDPLRGEALDFLNGVVGCVDEELAD